MSTRRRPSPRLLGAGVVGVFGWVPIACLLAVTTLVSIAGITWVTSPYWGRNPVAQARNVGEIPTQGGLTSDDISPNRIVIPQLKTSAPITQVGTSPDGELDVPLNPKIVGWWRYGAKPGARVGTAILAGHVNYSGTAGSMARIGALRPGEFVYVYGTHNADHQAKVRFRVTGVRTYHKTRLPYREIFDQKSVGRVAIVTCGGPFDASTGNYLDNIVVFGVPA